MFTIINARIYTYGPFHAWKGQLTTSNRGIFPSNTPLGTGATLSCRPHVGRPKKADSFRLSRQTCAFCGAATVSAHKFADELQYLELDEVMALSERQECPFSDKTWHREVEMLEAAAGEAASTDSKRRLWDRIISIISAHLGEVASHNKELDIEFGF